MWRILSELVATLYRFIEVVGNEMIYFSKTDEDDYFFGKKNHETRADSFYALMNIHEILGSHKTSLSCDEKLRTMLGLRKLSLSVHAKNEHE